MSAYESNADDAVWRRAEIQSPCKKICVIQPASNLCVGCLRTREEIAGWSRLTPEARAEIMAALPERRPLLRADRPSRRRPSDRRRA